MKSSVRMLFGVLLLALLVTGCATNRGVVSLQIEDAATPSVLNGQTVFISAVQDLRVFEENPATADIPSLGLGGAAAASEEIKKRAIARKRNSYGKALGDILLDENQTVETVVRRSLAKALIEDGYEVVSSREGLGPNGMVLEVDINKFWSWMKPGFWAITLSSEIEVVIQVKQPKQDAREIYVHSEGNYQVASGGNWLEIMNSSLGKFNTAVKEEF